MPNKQQWMFTLEKAKYLIKISAMKSLFTISLLCISNLVFGQVSTEITVDKNSYEVGETITLKASYFNDSDEIHTYRGSSSEKIRLVFSGVNLFGDGVTTDDARDTLFIGDKRELTWELDTSKLFLPKTDGEQTVVVNYLGIVDSVSFNANQFLGGKLTLHYEEVDSSTVQAMADSVNATIEEIGEYSTVWSFSDVQIDSMADELIVDPRILEIQIPERYFIEVASYIATSNENEQLGLQNYRLDQNYPNPFNPSTSINFNIPTAQNIRLSVFNIVGQEVAVLQDGRLPAGLHSINFSGENLASGTYIYKLKTSEGVLSRTFTLIK